MDELSCHKSSKNDILMIGFRDIVIMFGSVDGCFSSLNFPFGMKSRIS